MKLEPTKGEGENTVNTNTENKMDKNFTPLIWTPRTKINQFNVRHEGNCGKAYLIIRYLKNRDKKQVKSGQRENILPRGTKMRGKAGVCSATTQGTQQRAVLCKTWANSNSNNNNKSKTVKLEICMYIFQNRRQNNSFDIQRQKQSITRSPVLVTMKGSPPPGRRKTKPAIKNTLNCKCVGKYHFFSF